MARQRFIWPDLWTDPELGRLDPVELLFFIGCFSNADDEGRLLGEPAYLRATVFPYQDMTLKRIKDVRDSTVRACNNLVLYVVEETDYLAFLRWSRYQHPKYAKPSKLPAPNGVPPALEEVSPKVPPLGRDGLGSKEANASSSEVASVYDHWRTVWKKTDPRYDTLSQKRKRVIVLRLREFPASDLRRAIDGSRLDPWEDRSRHHDLTVLFRDQEQVDKFLDMASRPKAGDGVVLRCPECELPFAGWTTLTAHRRNVHDVVAA